MKVSTVDPINEDVSGATNHFFFLNYQKFEHLIIELTKKATPDPIAILIEIKSAKFVENKNVKPIPIKNPK